MDLHGARVVLTVLAPAHRDALRRIRRTPEVAERWGPDDPDDPDEAADDVVRYAVLLNGTVIGLVQYGEEPDPMYRHASVDLYLDPAMHGR